MRLTFQRRHLKQDQRRGAHVIKRAPRRVCPPRPWEPLALFIACRREGRLCSVRRAVADGVEQGASTELASEELRVEGSDKFEVMEGQ